MPKETQGMPAEKNICFNRPFVPDRLLISLLPWIRGFYSASALQTALLLVFLPAKARVRAYSILTERRCGFHVRTCSIHCNNVSGLAGFSAGHDGRGEDEAAQ